MRAAVDNDILFKGASYGILTELITAVCEVQADVGVLGSARFVLGKKISTSPLLLDRAAARASFSAFMGQARILEPTDEERGLAADFEFAAQEIGVSLDAGESQLCAISVNRLLSLLITGDKRAIQGLERLLDKDSRLLALSGKVACLEQVFMSAISQLGHERLRCAVCAEPDVDKALTICFSCRSNSASVESHVEGLQSYIADLRTLASRVLSM
jgi:hypothetical protein